MQVVTNAERLTRFNPNWTGVEFVRLDNIEERKEHARQQYIARREPVPSDDKLKWYYEKYRLDAFEQGLANSRIFMGSLPSGRYRLAGLSSEGSDGETEYRLYVGVSRELGGFFEVASGEFVDLGTVLYQPLQKPPWIKPYQYRISVRGLVARVAGSDDLATWVRQVTPHLGSAMNFDSPTSWHVDTHESLRRRVLEAARENLYVDEFIRLEHHALGAMPSRLGHLRLLGRDGRWSLIRLPTQAQILSAVATPESIAFGAERGQLFVSTSLDGDWRRIQALPPDREIAWLGRHAGDFIVVARIGRQQELYRAPDLGGAWELIRKEPISASKGGMFPVVGGSRLRVLSRERLLEYDTANQAWRETEKYGLARMRQLDRDTVVGVRSAFWSEVGSQVVSFDAGDNWIEILRVPGKKTGYPERGMPTVSSSGDLITISRQRVRLIGNVAETTPNEKFYLVSIARDAVHQKERWRYHGEVRKDCASILPEISTGSRIYVVCDTGQIMLTDDFGTTWQTPVPVDFHALQKKFGG